MTNVKFEVSEHAKLRFKERRITRRQVKFCILKGQSFCLDIGGRMVKTAKFGSKRLLVVYIHSKSSYIIITAYWR